MPSGFTHIVALGLSRAERGTSLFGGCAASAEARITLAVIATIGMAGPGLIRHADDSDRQAEVGRSRAMRVADELQFPIH